MLKYEPYHFGGSTPLCYYNPHGLNYPRHLHRNFEVIYVTNGNMEVSVGSKTFEISKSDCILILPYEIHSITTKTYSDTNICVFSPEYVKAFHNMIDGKILEMPVFKLSPNTEAFVLDKIFKDTLDILQLKACLYLICSEIMGQTNLIDSTKQDYELLHKALTYIQENFTKDISLNDVSAECGCSYNYLSKYLKNTLGSSFVDFINENRINYALYLLKNTQNTITDIAYTCGYSSIRSFNRNFLKITNKTPKAFRNS